MQRVQHRVRRRQVGPPGASASRRNRRCAGGSSTPHSRRAEPPACRHRAHGDREARRAAATPAGGGTGARQAAGRSARRGRWPRRLCRLIRCRAPACRAPRWRRAGNRRRSARATRDRSVSAGCWRRARTKLATCSAAEAKRRPPAGKAVDGASWDLRRGAADARQQAGRARGRGLEKRSAQSRTPTQRGRRSALCRWLRGQDLNLRPLGYEPNELPDCSTSRLSLQL